MSAALSINLPQPLINGRYLVSRGGAPYFTNQFTAAYSLLDLYAEPARMKLVTPPVLCARLLGVARLLDFAHQQGISHRNLHPACILWSEAGELAISRWENALTLEQASSGDSAVTSVIGTPGYMPPEQVRKENRFEPRSDLFSFGALLYEGLTSKAPFPGKNPLEIGLATLERESTPVHNVLPSCPLALSLLCEKLMEKVASDRMSNAKELIEALEIFSKDVTPVEIDRAVAFAETMDSESDAAATVAEAAPAAHKEPEKAPIQPSQPSQPSRSNASQPSPYLSANQVDQLSKMTGLPKVAPESYKVIDELGRGGLGRVNRVHDNRLQRVVAVKELLRYNAQSRDRFLREALLTARLQHPGIIPIYEAGMWPSGEIFYAMKMVQGEPLDKLIAKNKTLEARAALLPQLLTASEAMAYAHANKIIHRDLKPANILVGEYGETVVIDWGLAKDLADHELKEDPMNEHYRAQADGGLTMDGAIMGTPAYMPPEQAKGKPVDERADVYSLGAILYHMLAGASPYQGRNSRAVLLEVAEGKLIPLEEKQPGTPKDLLAIVKKAMATEAEQRYATADSFAKDLKKFLTGQLVEAYQYTTAEKIGRWFKKNKTIVSVGVASLLAVAIVGSYSLYQIYHEQELRIGAEKKSALASAEALQLKEAENQGLIEAQKKSAIANVKRLLDENPSEALAAINELGADVPERTKDFWRAEAFSRGVPRSLTTLNNVVTSMAIAKTGDQAFLATENGAIVSVDLKTKTSTTLKSDPDAVRALQLSPDGGLLVGVSDKDQLFIWSTSQQKSSQHTPLTKEHLRFTKALHDNQTLVLASAETGRIFLQNTATNTITSLEGEAAPTASLDISADERWLASGSEDTKLYLWDLSACQGKTSCTPKKTFTSHQAGIVGVRFDRSNDVIYSVDQDGLVLATDLKTQRATKLSVRNVQTSRFELSPDSSRLAINTTEGLYLIDLKTRLTKRMPGLPDTGILLAFSHDSSRLAVVSSTNELWLWDLTEDFATKLMFHRSIIADFAFSRDDSQIISTDGDGVVAAWDLSPLFGNYVKPTKQATDIEVSPDQQYMALATSDGATQLWPLSCLSQPCETSKTLQTQSQALVETRFSKSSLFLAALNERGTAFLWDLRQDKPRTLLEGGAINLSFSPTEDLLAIASDDHNVELFDLKNDQHTSLIGHADVVTAVAFSPDGKTLASASADGTIRLWDVPTRKLLRVQTLTIFALLEWSPRGDLLVAADQQFNIHRLRVTEGEMEDQIISHGEHKSFLRRLSFSDDGATFMSTDFNLDAVLWEAASGEHYKLPKQNIGDLTAKGILSLGPSNQLRLFQR